MQRLLSALFFIGVSALSYTAVASLLSLPLPMPPLWIASATLLTLLSFLTQYRYQQKSTKDLEKTVKNLKKQLKTQTKEHQQKVAHLEHALNSGRLATWEWDIKKNTAYFSELWQDLIGFTEHNFPQDLHAWQNRIHPHDAPIVQKALLQILSGKQDYYENIHRVRHHDGHYIWVYDRGQVFYDELGNVARFSAVRIDVSEQKAHEQALRLDHELLQNTQDAIAIADSKGDFIRTNPAFARTFGMGENEQVEVDLKTLLDNIQDEPPIDVLDAVEKKGQWRGDLVLRRHNNEIALANTVDIHKVTTAEGDFYTLVCTDITEHLRNTQMLDKLAYEDQVTGLANRHQFYRMLPRFIQQADYDQSSFTLMFIDLDDFKQVNDTLGHDVGDQLLRKVGEIITENIDEHAHFARLGGDEFVIICDQHTDIDQLEKIGQRLNQLLTQPFKIDNHTVKIGSSIGMAIYPYHGKNQSQLLQNADAAMYHAKQSGKGTTTIYSHEMDKKPKLETLPQTTSETTNRLHKR